MKAYLYFLGLFLCAGLIAESAIHEKQFAGVRTKALSEYLQKEEAPISKDVISAKPTPIESGAITRVAMALGIVLSLGAVVFLAFRIIKKQPQRDGNRKYLIEKMSYCSLGPKMGVSLIKVGKEFVLVGVTPDNISFLSKLEKLQEQYEEDSKFERDNFKEAVEQEFLRIKGNAEIQV